MSKNFENEYITLTQTTAPDLWDRIEKGLTPRNMQEFTAESESAQKSASKPETGSRQESAPKGIFFFRKYKAVLTAAICVILILPAAVHLGKSGIGLGRSVTEGIDTTAEESAPQEAEVTEAAEEAVMEMAELAPETAEEKAPAEGVMQEAATGKSTSKVAVTDQAVSEEAAEMKRSADASDKKKAAQEAKIETEISSKAENGENTAQKQKDPADTSDLVVNRIDAADGTMLDHVIVQVYALEKASEVGEQGATPAVFRALVLEDAEGLLKEGDEIQIALSPFSAILWTEEEAVYEVMLEYDSTREYPFYLQGCY